MQTDIKNTGNEQTVNAQYDNLSGFEKLSGLQLNNIKLDVKHTLLTPEYLENLTASKT